jgi:hypothetical protein
MLFILNTTLFCSISNNSEDTSKLFEYKETEQLQYIEENMVEYIQSGGNTHISSPRSKCSDPVQIGIATHATGGDLV